MLTPPPPQDVHFVEVRRDAVARVDRRAGGARIGAGGLAVADVDGDGRDDLYVGRASGLPNRLLVRGGGSGELEDAAPRLGLDLLDATLGAAFEDLDGDGAREAIVFGAALHVLKRGADGRFEPAPQLGLLVPAGFAGACTAAAIADVDQDGDLDLFVATHRAAPGRRALAAPYPLFDAVNGPRNLFFRNEGDGRLRECLDEAGLAPGATRLASDARFADLTGDGAPELVVANEFGRSQLFVNDGAGRFREVVLEVEGEGAAFAARPRGAGPREVRGATRFLGLGDLDGDGRTDLFFAAASDPAGERALAGAPAWLELLSPRTRDDAEATVRGGTAMCAAGDSWQAKSAELGLEQLGPFTGGLLADLFGDVAPEVLLLEADEISAPGGAAGERDASSKTADSDEWFWREAVPQLAREGVDPEEVAARLSDGARSAGTPREPPLRPARLLARDSSGRYADARADLVSLPGGSRAVAWDFDGDGDRDLAVAGDRGFELVLLRQDAAGSDSGAPPAQDDAKTGATTDAPAVDLLAVHPRVPAPALELPALSGARVELHARRPRPAVVYVDRGDGDPIVRQARDAGARAASCDVIVLDAAAAEPAVREAVAAVRELVSHVTERDVEAAALRVDREGFVDLLAWGAGPEEAAAASAPPPAGRWLVPPKDDPFDLAERYLAADLATQALRALERYEREGFAPLDEPIGRVLARLRRWRPAAERLARVPITSPDYGRAQLELGRCLLRLEQPREARTAFEIAVARRPADAAAHFELGRATLLLATDAKSANPGTEALRAATYLKPDWAEAQIWFGQGLARVGRRDEAELAFTRAAELDPKNGQPHFELAKLLLALGRIDEALTHAERSAELTPGNPTTKNLIDRIRAAQAAAQAGGTPDDRGGEGAR